MKKLALALALVLGIASMQAGVLHVVTFPLRHPVKTVKALTFPVRHPVKFIK